MTGVVDVSDTHSQCDSQFTEQEILDCYNGAIDKVRTPSDNACEICGHDECWNHLCEDVNRQFERCHSIVVYDGIVKDSIHQFKFNNQLQWSCYYARVILGYLYSHRDAVESVDVIIAMPGNPDGKHFAELIVTCMRRHDTRSLPIPDRPVVVRTRTTRSMKSAKNGVTRPDIADEIYSALEVMQQRAVAGKRVMVVDDLFTSGNTLNAVARKLREAGARSVVGLALARTP